MHLLRKEKHHSFLLNPSSSRTRLPTFLSILFLLLLTQGQVAQGDSFSFSITNYEGKKRQQKHYAITKWITILQRTLLQAIRLGKSYCIYLQLSSMITSVSCNTIQKFTSAVLPAQDTSTPHARAANFIATGQGYNMLLYVKYREQVSPQH